DRWFQDRDDKENVRVCLEICVVQFLDDTDPFNSTNFPEPTRPPLYTFREDIALVTQLAGVHRLLRAPHKLDDCTLQLSHNGTYLDLESTLVEQRDELEGFQEDAGYVKYLSDLNERHPQLVSVESADLHQQRVVFC
uniref:FHOD1 N-terminal GTPase-binding domain-containing protein n=1 Tax=Chrysemys picta bellii TaxID=8478 RepID=A0A8C3IK87_CHRPI